MDVQGFHYEMAVALRRGDMDAAREVFDGYYGRNENAARGRAYVDRERREAAGVKLPEIDPAMNVDLPIYEGHGRRRGLA